jgi:hypothetical protein
MAQPARTAKVPDPRGPVNLRRAFVIWKGRPFTSAGQLLDDGTYFQVPNPSKPWMRATLMGFWEADSFAEIK